MDYELLFLKSLVLTIFIETVVLVLIFRLLFKTENIKINRLVSTGLFASFSTLPYLWFVLPYFVSQKIAYVIIGESFAVIVETFIIRLILKTTLSKSFAASFTCNFISFSIGLLLNWP